MCVQSFTHPMRVTPFYANCDAEKLDKKKMTVRVDTLTSTDYIPFDKKKY